MKSLLKSTALGGLAVLLVCSTSVGAYVPEANHADDIAKHGKVWTEEDKAIDKQLAALEKKHGKKPNIIYVLTDDIGWGQLGSYGGGKVVGTPTPNLDQIAANGMRFVSAYAEPSCTPTRLALLTGRHPPRTGVNLVLWPGMREGLVSSEYTIAELLSDAGYKTAMWGKWHVGDVRDEHLPHNQGFDFAQYSPYNGAVWSWEDDASYYRDHNVLPGNSPHFLDVPEDYFERYDIEKHYIWEGLKGQKAKKLKPANAETYQDIDTKRTDEIIEYIGKNAKGDKPFFIYFPSDAHNAVSANNPAFRFNKHVDKTNNMAVTLVEHDYNMGRIVKALKDNGIAENTLLVWISDNGPMYGHSPNMGYSHLRGGKGDVYEGGIRVPALAYWPGMIEAGQDPIDMLHVTDLYTTAARIAGAKKRIKSDRVTDGIDQTALLLNGEDSGRRFSMIHYSGSQIGAVRLDARMKIHFKGVKGGLPVMETYNIVRDMGERDAKAVYRHLQWTAPLFLTIEKHKAQIEKYPHTKLDPKTGAEIK